MTLARPAKRVAVLALGLAAAVLLAAFALPKPLQAPTASAASADYYLKLDGIDGESTDAGHAGQIEVQSWSWGVSNPSTVGPGSGGSGAGKIKFNEFTIKKTIDKASPALFMACATGKHIKEGVLSVTRKAKGGSEDYYKVTLTDAMCSSWNQQGAGDDLPTESVSFN